MVRCSILIDDDRFCDGTMSFVSNAAVVFLLFFCFKIRLIDSKVEEGTHTYSSSTKFDPVLSGNVTVQYQSSQRLIDEICEMNDKKKDNAKASVSTTTHKKSKTSTSVPSSVALKRNESFGGITYQTW
jgi:hypothetical protein